MHTKYKMDTLQMQFILRIEEPWLKMYAQPDRQMDEQTFQLMMKEK